MIAVIVISFLLTRKNKATCEKEEEKEEEFSINLGAIEIDTLMIPNSTLSDIS